MEIIQGSETSAKIKLTLRYSVQRQTLVVNVHHIEGLQFDEPKNLHVQTNILPDKLKETVKNSKVVTTSKNPVFDQSFEYNILQEDFDNKHLEVSIFEENNGKGQIPISKVTIDLNKLGLVLPYTNFYQLYQTAL